MTKKTAMAYAIGCVRVDGSCTDNKRVRLGDIFDEWKGYKLVGFGSEKRDRSYMLVYDGAFGKSKISSSLIHTSDAWDIDHMAHILVTAIDCHKAEAKE